uniref:non-specific serine/threonine protein kinase n=1 Tax=Chenopodium quinoa TaxID=63459 RepID=A0A803LKV9_CHEQI
MKCAEGEGDAVDGVVRGDLSVSDCQDCIADSTKRLPEDCSTQKEAIGYHYSNCMVRYANRPIFGIKELSPNCTSLRYKFKIPASDVEKFRYKLSILFDGLKNVVSARDSRNKFAIGFENVTASLSVYGLMQCNPDLSNSDCSDCLQVGIRQLEPYFSNVTGAGIYGPSCSLQFENYRFMYMSSNSQLPILSPSASPSNHSQRKGWNSHKKWIVIVVVLLIPLAALGLWLSGKRKKRIHKQVRNNVQITCVDSLQFDYITIQDATDSFSNAKRLGKGSPTKVYKGKLPNNEQEIAVKQLTINGRHSELEFNNEVWLLADLQHRNLVKLLGFCIEKDSRFLIYEYLPNESLDWFLCDSVKRAHLNWETRYKIILGIARGLLYLHEDSQVTVIHRDLKPSNILLDLAMNPKISNFSKASVVHADQTRGDSTTVLGTYGYMPPEYVKLGHFSVKSDVFSFGVLLLEIISGKLISEFSDGGRGESLPSFAWRKWVEGKAVEAVDQSLPQLQREMTQILKCIKIALLCVQENPTSRPNMSTVVFMLNSNIVSSIAEPSRPAFIIFSDMYQPSSSSSSQKDKSNEASVNEASISYLDPR